MKKRLTKRAISSIIKVQQKEREENNMARYRIEYKENKDIQKIICDLVEKSLKENKK